MRYTCVQYVLWYGFLGTFLGRKLLGLARLLQPLGSLGSLLVGIPGSKTAFANKQLWLDRGVHRGKGGARGSNVVCICTAVYVWQIAETRCKGHARL